MTVWDALRGLWRRRVLTAVGIAATMLLLTLVGSQPGVFWSQANVVFYAPPTERNPNVMETTSSSLIAAAGYVERLVDAGVEKPATASSVTLLGQGIRNGHSIGLPDEGGQWSHNFTKALLNVQVTGPTAAVVQTRLDNLIAKIRRTTQEIQDHNEVSSAIRITTEVTPQSPQISYATGGRTRALAAALLLGLGITVFCVTGIDRLLSRRGRETPQSIANKKVPVSV